MSLYTSSCIYTSRLQVNQVVCQAAFLGLIEIGSGWLGVGYLRPTCHWSITISLDTGQSQYHTCEESGVVYQQSHLVLHFLVLVMKNWMYILSEVCVLHQVHPTSIHVSLELELYLLYLSLKESEGKEIRHAIPLIYCGNKPCKGSPLFHQS